MITPQELPIDELSILDHIKLFKKLHDEFIENLKKYDL